MKTAIAALACLTLMAAPVAQAQGQRDIVSMGGMTGTCTQLTVAGQDKSAVCQSNMLIITYSDGAVSHGFIANTRESGEQALLSFFGDAGAATTDAAGVTHNPISLVSNLSDAEVRTGPVTGDCQVTGDASKPTFTCQAELNSEAYSATFVSDGTPAAVTPFQ